MQLIISSYNVAAKKATIFTESVEYTTSYFFRRTDQLRLYIFYFLRRLRYARYSTNLNFSFFFFIALNRNSTLTTTTKFFQKIIGKKL
ncbi:hypothetical protein RclHR1_00190011 [Rhizophagus clarus]|uniref:Uncharacterized protein n=1 Tax=Rhizophagus clarus TaxID=94130 RepID=A0A2Z6RGL4_9GLOM|nr:hypothetical protein RclHR1_00190011 [Rhizophagus clarus]